MALQDERSEGTRRAYAAAHHRATEPLKRLIAVEVAAAQLFERTKPRSEEHAHALDAHTAGPQKRRQGRTAEQQCPRQLNDNDTAS
jgi:hypothetical protein